MVYIILIITSLIVISLIIYLIFVLYSKYSSDKLNIELSNSNPNKVQSRKRKTKVKKIINNNIKMVIKNNNKKNEIEIELFDKQLPITCRNFRHIAKVGLQKKTYKNTFFYKVVKNKYLIGGDIVNNDGTGKLSLYGKDFIDEKFVYDHKTPGLLTMENSGEDTNNSQFIITLKDMPEFDKKHVVFGRVVKGLYSLYEIEEGATIVDIN